MANVQRRQRAKPRDAKTKSAVSHPMTLDAEQHKAFIHAIGQSCVGIVGRDGLVIGTGTFIKAGDRLAILTAGHVIQGCAVADLRFFLPKSGGQIADTPLRSLGHLQADQVIPRVSLPLQAIHEDAQLDIALLVLANSIDTNPLWSFRRPARRRSLTPGHTLMMMGYPGQRAHVLPDKSKMVFKNIDYPTILPPIDHRDFDPGKHILVDFPSAAEFDPHGYSGAALWYNVPRKGAIWRPDPEVGGMVIEYLRKEKALIALKFDAVLDFVNKHVPAKVRSAKAKAKSKT